MLDHLVLATPDLAASVAALTADGIALVEGGPHVGVGTRSHLAGPGTRPRPWARARGWPG